VKRPVHRIISTLYLLECVEGEFSEVSLKSKDWDFLRSQLSISAMLGM
jgi:hypothetical protein